MAEPEPTQQQRKTLRAFRQATAQRAKMESEAHAQRKRELDAVAAQHQSALAAAKQELESARAQAAAELAAVDNAADQGRSALSSVGLLDLIPLELSTGDRLDFGLTPLTARSKLESSRQRAVEAAERITRDAKTLQAERATQATLRTVAAIGGVIVFVILLFDFLAKQQTAAVAQQAAATSTVVAQQAVATSTAASIANATATSIARGIPIIEPRGSDSAEMAFVPAGEFTMGSDSGEHDEKPMHRILLDAFWIDVFEVINAQYKKCVDAGKCQPPSSSSSNRNSSYFGNSQFDNYPVIYVSWEDANAYCAWAGKRLPAEAEWEKAARGTDARIYPWGNDWDVNKVNADNRVGDTTPVGSYPAGVSPYGALDMAGNVLEWVADWYDSGYYANSPRENPKGPFSEAYRVLRGGAWNLNRVNVRAADRINITPDDRYSNVGFRCAQ